MVVGVSLRVFEGVLAERIVLWERLHVVEVIVMLMLTERVDVHSEDDWMLMVLG